MYVGELPPSHAEAQAYRVNRPAYALGELGAAFLSKKQEPKRGGMFGVKRSGPGPVETANRYEGSSCPPGQSVVRRETDQHAPKFAGGPTRTDYVYCRPAPAAGPAPAPEQGPSVSPTITVSPTFQQQFTPQISPVFQQVQDSPGAQQGASPIQSAPGGQEATGGGAGDSGALLAFMREQEERRRQEDQARRAAEERRRQEDAMARRRQQELEAQQRAEQDRARQQEQAEREAELEELRSQMRQPAAQPQVSYIPGSAPSGPRPARSASPPATQPQADDAGGIPTWAILAGGAALALVAFAGGNRKPARKR